MEKCDRCGLDIPKPIGFITFHDYSDFPASADMSKQYLCKSCTNDFVSWKNKYKETSNSK